jgi:hypothetical protein
MRTAQEPLLAAYIWRAGDLTANRASAGKQRHPGVSNYW